MGKNLKIVVILFVSTLTLWIVEEYLLDKNYMGYLSHLVYGYKQIPLFKVLVYIMTSFLSFVVIVLSLFTKNKKVFFFFISMVSIAYLVDIIYLQVMGKVFSFHDLETVLMEMDKFSLVVLSTFSNLLIKSLVYLGIGVLLVILLRFYIKKHHFFISTFLVMAMWILSIGLAFGIYVKTAGFSNKVSTPIAMIDTILYKLYIDPYCGKRKSVTKSCGVSKINHIVFIVDESISAKYLSLNGYDKKTTPFLDSIADNILNYGFISSGANGSASSNMILMSGITLDELPDRSYKALKVPNIFQYAKKVGYTTSYISGQTRELQNYMSKYDIDTIDNFFKTDYTTFQLQKTPEKDIVDEVLKQINEHNKTFMFIVKRGAHFHYEHTYPQNNKVFSPTLKRDEPISLYNKKRVINSYCNAILWRVDGFFESLYRELHLDSRNDTIIIYTSDHGQSILENGTVATHNVSVNPNPSQGIVPLLVMPSSLDILHNKKVLKNHYTHFQLFPTLLWLMGYSDLNHTIFDTKISISQVFFSGDLFGRAGTSKTEISYE